MREIKFRAWYARKKSPGTMSYYPVLVRNREDVWTTEYPETAVLMQYTGLKDKNGKEIYEGDICRYQEWLQPDLKGECQIHKIKFGYCSFDFGDCPLYEWLDEEGNIDIEVIGNIYENPELLNR